MHAKGWAVNTTKWALLLAAAVSLPAASPLTASADREEGSGWQPSKHVSSMDGHHVITGHEQPPRLRRVSVSRALVVKTSPVHMSTPCSLLGLVGNCVDFAIFI
jgi:hypothetical protein